MTYQQLLSAERLSRLELLAVSLGNLVEDPPAEMPRLPAPPLLMLDRVVEIERRGSSGFLIAEQDVAPDAWYFLCHFRNDPVQPGSLGLDAVWQAMGLFCILCGATGTVRALGCREFDLEQEIRPYHTLVRYETEIRRIARRGNDRSWIAVASTRVLVDGMLAYTITDAKVGLFPGLTYSNYPHVPSKVMAETA